MYSLLIVFAYYIEPKAVLCNCITCHRTHNKPKQWCGAMKMKNSRQTNLWQIEIFFIDSWFILYDLCLDSVVVHSSKVHLWKKNGNAIPLRCILCANQSIIFVSISFVFRFICRDTNASINDHWNGYEWCWDTRGKRSCLLSAIRSIRHETLTKSIQMSFVWIQLSFQRESVETFPCGASELRAMDQFN